MTYALLIAAGAAAYLWNSSVDTIRILARSTLLAIVLWSLTLWSQS